MHTISKSVVCFLMKNATVAIERRDWCVYALEKKLNKALCFTLVLLLGFCFLAPIECALVFITTNFLRTKISGWHAQSSDLCVILTVGLCCGGGVFAVWAADVFPFVVLPFFLNNACLCLFFSPVENVRLHLTKEEMQQNKKLGSYRIIIVMAASLVVLLIPSLQSYAIGLQIGAFFALASTYIKE